MRPNWWAILFIVAFGIAAVPVSNAIWENYVTPLQPAGHAQRVGTDGGPLMLSTSLDGGNRPYTDERDAWCVPWGSLLVIKGSADNPVCVCMSLEDEVAQITMGSGPTCGVMTDTDDAGVPNVAAEDLPCTLVVGRHDIKVSKAWYGNLQSNTTSAYPTLPGQRDGYCSQPRDTTRSPYAGGNTGAPCNQDIDCVRGDGGPGTCTDNTPSGITCAYFIVEAATEVVYNFELER